MLKLGSEYTIEYYFFKAKFPGRFTFSLHFLVALFIILCYGGPDIIGNRRWAGALPGPRPLVTLCLPGPGTGVVKEEAAGREFPGRAWTRGLQFCPGGTGHCTGHGAGPHGRRRIVQGERCGFPPYRFWRSLRPLGAKAHKRPPSPFPQGGDSYLLDTHGYLCLWPMRTPHTVNVPGGPARLERDMVDYHGLFRNHRLYGDGPEYAGLHGAKPPSATQSGEMVSRHGRGGNCPHGAGSHVPRDLDYPPRHELVAAGRA